MGMNIDMSDFEKGFKKLMETSTPEALAKGMFAAGNRLLQDAKYEEPCAPFDKGPLHRSGRVDAATVTKDNVETTVGFNIEYAARWHELSPAEDARISWTTPGSGRKYLETKMDRNKKRYLDLVGENLKALLGG